MKLKLLPKFIISLGIVGLVLTVAISLFSYATSKSYLEEMYAERVMTNSNAIAAMLDIEDVKAILAEGGDGTPEYKEMYDLFNQLKKDGDITYLSLVVPDEDSVCFYIDAMVEEMGDDPANQLPYGSDILYVDAANPDDPADMEKYITIWERYRDNKGIDTPLVTDNDYGYNYTGVSVILDENGNAIAEIQYILDMSEVRAYLNSFLINMLLISFAIIGITIILYIFFVRKMVTKPVGKLTAFTQEITKTGTFENQHIDIKTGDEIESLSQSFNFMLAELENYIANLSKVTAEKERIGAELDIAKHIQASMLPCIFPAFPERKEFDIYATMEPAKEVGGDFYDFFMVDDTHLAIVMADVSGKGVPAALFMVIGKTLIKDHTTPGRDLGKVFTEVNQLLCESNSEELFITAFEGVLDLVTGEFVYVNAGHEMPFICKAGGDFYDFFMVDDTHLAIVMADVSGKGVPAALFMVIGKTLIKDHTTPGRDLGKVFTEVNQLLCESNSEELFITAFEGVLDLVTGEFVYVNAGHEMPFICKAGGDFEPYKIRAGFVLAGMEGMKYRAGSTRLEPGDKIFQYTDGVTEATNLKNELYGMNRLGAILNKVKGGTPNDILPAIKKDIDEFVGDADQFDDITMLCLEYKARMETNEEDAQ